MMQTPFPHFAVAALFSWRFRLTRSARGGVPSVRVAVEGQRADRFKTALWQPDSYRLSRRQRNVAILFTNPVPSLLFEDRAKTLYGLAAVPHFLETRDERCCPE